MKSRFLPVLLLPAQLLLANHESITDAAGYVAPLAISLTLCESVGANLLTDDRREAADAKGVTYPDYTTFSTTYTPDTLVAGVVNPFGWESQSSKGNHYVERVTTDSRDPESPVVTAAGQLKTVKSRFTNATLLSDLVTRGDIDSTAGYRIVAVRLDIHHEYHFMTSGGYNTHVNDHYYFYAEKGADDPDPKFLGAEYNDIYVYNQIVGLTRATQVRSGKYTDTFTGRPDGGGYDYTLSALNYGTTAAGEFFFYRPAPGEGAFYKITAQGLYRWTERYNKAGNFIGTGPIVGKGLVGPAQGYFGVPDDDHEGIYHEYTPNAGNQAFVTGTIKAGAATRYESMLKYLNKIPPVMPH